MLDIIIIISNMVAYLPDGIVIPTTWGVTFHGDGSFITDSYLNFIYN